MTGRPWRNYGKAELVNEFCENDPYTTIGRLMFLREAAAQPEVRTLVEKVQREVESFHCAEKDTFYGYDKWLTWHRGIVHNGNASKKKGRAQFLEFKWAVPTYDSEDAYLFETPCIFSGDFLNSVPDAMERFVPEPVAEIETRIKAEQENDHPSPDKCINISITTERLVRLVNGIKGARRKKR